MDQFTQIRIEGSQVRAIFLTSDIAQANMLRRAILGNIETYAIDRVTFYDNTSPLPDESLAFLLGQLVIDNEKYDKGDNYTFTIKLENQEDDQLYLTTDALPQLPFRYTTPITVLKKNKKIWADLTVVRGNGVAHCKWRPVSTCTIKAVEEGYEISFRTIGMLDGRRILEEGFNKIAEAAQEKPITIFSHVLAPRT